MKLFPLVGFSLLISTQIFLFAPVLLYTGNIVEFSAPLTEVLQAYTRPASFLAALLVLTGIVAQRRGSALYSTLLAGFSILLWFQGNVLVWEYGALTGSDFDWSKDVWRGYLDAAIWIGVLGVIVLAYKTLGGSIRLLAVILFAFQIVGTLHSVVTNADSLSQKSDFYRQFEIFDEIRKFSTSQNIIHIVMDGFQSDIFAQIVNSPEQKSFYAGALEGFTFFDQHLGAYPFTHMSIPAMLSGLTYKNNSMKDEFVTKTVSGQTILRAASENGFEVDLAINSALDNIYSLAPHTNNYQVSSQSATSDRERIEEEAAFLIDVSLFRLFPHHIKRLIYNNQHWFVQNLLLGGSKESFQVFTDNNFLVQLSEKLEASRPDPVYKLFHLMISHNPFVTGLDCKFAGEIYPANIRAAVFIQSKCGLDSVLKLLEMLKEEGIYDNSLIVLMGDHGAWTTPTGSENETSPEGVQFWRKFPMVLAMATPLMAIKPPGARGDLKIIGAPTSITDLPATISSIGEFGVSFPGNSMFSLREEDQRTRNFHVYHYRPEDRTTSGHLSPIMEYSVTGSPYQSKNWKIVKLHK